ncbi:hypothetical protein BCR43DRAFT_462599 [Syncephalastrum racemosum]|uniref:Cytochrome c oxidase polypeptide VIIA n=1 Tax=Syncephalastrum racemosum TaxID=13706 RepID=A0A1X2H538_SYNRA|nr:hypothetical protein BCR43DRAFT_462599 [Syncephalastrum racemosum]
MIQPIVGKFRKALVRDIAIALTLGAVAGATFWRAWHIPNVRARDAYYAKLEANKSK